MRRFIPYLKRLPCSRSPASITRRLRASPASLLQLHRAPQSGLWQRWASTTSEGEDAKEKEGEEDGDAKALGEESAAVPVVPHWSISMPSIVEGDRYGEVLDWNFSAGSEIKATEVICTVELELGSIGLQVEEDGYIAQILVPAGSGKVPVGTPLAVLVRSEEDIEKLFKQQQSEAPVAHGFTSKDVMGIITTLHKAGSIDEDLAVRLLECARHKDSDLFAAFDGSFKGQEYDEEEFDKNMFLLQAKDIIKHRDSEQEES